VASRARPGRTRATPSDPFEETGARRPGHDRRAGQGLLRAAGCTRGCLTGPPRTKDAMSADDATPIDSAGPNSGRSPATRRRARGPHWRSSNVNDPTIGAHEPRSTLPRRSRMVASSPRGRRPALGESAWAAHRGSSGDPRRRTGGQPVPHDAGAEACPSCGTAADAIGSTAVWCLGRTTRPSQPSVGHWGVEQCKRVDARTRLPTAGRSCQRASAGVDRALREHRQAKAESAEKVRPPGWRSRTWVPGTHAKHAATRLRAHGVCVGSR